MCIQRHPCKYKCFENYSALYRQFPSNSVKSTPCGCGCNKPKPMLPCFQCMPCPQKPKNKYSFCIQGSIKFDGFC